MENLKKKIAILGCGPSGLVAAKEALANGLEPTVFEKECNLGGVWNPETGAVWGTMHTNISKFTTTFGDTTWPQDTEMFPNSRQVFEYLQNYSDKWNITELIKFQSTVINVKPLDKKRSSADLCDSYDSLGTNGWVITWIEGDEKLEKSEEFSGVILATGIFAKPNIPNDISGMDTFTGRILHSKEYKSGRPFEGQKVLVVGGSFSGVEIASDIANHAKETCHSFREPFWILKRYLPDGTRNSANLPIDLVFYNRQFYSNLNSSSSTKTPEEITKAKNENLLKLCHEQQDLDELKVPLESMSKPITTIISDQYLNQVKESKILVKRQNIVKVQGSKVIFQNGDEIDGIDSIIFGTGFHTDLHNYILDQKLLDLLSYDPNDRLQPLILLNATVHPDIKNLFFVGMYKGPYLGVMEQQARWACKVLSQKVQLPPRDQMLEGLSKERAIREQRPRPQFPHPDYVLFADKISECGSSFPDLDKLQDDKHTLAEALKNVSKIPYLLEGKKFEICSLFMNEPVIPAHYNLIQSPMDTYNQMQFLQQIIKQFTN